MLDVDASRKALGSTHPQCWLRRRGFSGSGGLGDCTYTDDRRECVHRSHSHGPCDTRGTGDTHRARSGRLIAVPLPVGRPDSSVPCSTFTLNLPTSGGRVPGGLPRPVSDGAARTRTIMEDATCRYRRSWTVQLVPVRTRSRAKRGTRPNPSDWRRRSSSLINSTIRFGWLIASAPVMRITVIAPARRRSRCRSD